ncbi:MAG: hypothetical protein K9N11_00550, partial [Lentisphaeria bacterium]|nr:hypothetical protein [Candidatus Neomarinimicrobiota bacterium]MCF7841316.1 hypothetical protein [Lentisphaeria bacterium]
MLTASAWAIVPFRADVHHLTPGAITISDGNLDFGDVSLGEWILETLWVYNGTEDTLLLSYQDMFTTSAVFDLWEWTSPVLPPMDSTWISVKFQPSTNILYEGFLLAQVSDCDQGIVVALAGAGRSSADYALTFNKFGEELKAALPNLFPGQTDLGYNGAR